MTHPIQSVTVDIHGTMRFKENNIVSYLLDHGGLDMNHLATLPFSREDREQFAQLIGYSLSGFADLSYTSDITLGVAYHMATHGQTEDQARIAVLTEKLNTVRESLRTLVPLLFNIHPDDLVE